MDGLKPQAPSLKAMPVALQSFDVAEGDHLKETR